MNRKERRPCRFGGASLFSRQRLKSKPMNVLSVQGRTGVDLYDPEAARELCARIVAGLAGETPTWSRIKELVGSM